MKKAIFIIALCVSALCSCSKEYVKSIEIVHESIYDGQIAIKLGSLVQLNVSILPEDSEAVIDWVSDDPSIVSVYDGLLEGLNPGVTDIHAIAPNGKKASLTVYVNRVQVTSWNQPSMIEVAPGDAAEFTVSNIKPEGATAASLIWGYSDGPANGKELKNDFTFSVNKNTVRIVVPNDPSFEGKHGYLESKDVKEADYRLTEICYVTRQISSISLHSTNGQSLTVGDKTTVTATYEPSNANVTTLDWSVSGNAVSFEPSDGTVIAIHSGTSTITATAKSGVSASITFTVSGKSIEGMRATFVGEKKQYSIEGGSIGIVKWSTSNTGIATIDENGVLDPHSAGIVKVIADDNGEISEMSVLVVRKGYQICFYRDFSFPDGDAALPFATGVKSESDVFITPGMSNGYKIGTSEYAFSSRWGEQNPMEGLYGADRSHAFTATPSGNLRGDLEGDSDIAFYAANAKVGDDCTLTVKDKYGASGTIHATVGFASITVKTTPNWSTTQPETYQTIKVGASAAVNRPSTDFTTLSFFGNTVNSFNANSNSMFTYSFSVWSSYYTLVCDSTDLSLMSSTYSQIVRIYPSTKAGTYKIYIKEYPEIYWNIVVR